MVLDEVLEFPSFWRTRWDLIAYVPQPPEEPDCPGHGGCHGCLKWCSYCGDVSDMCDADRCDEHHRYPEPAPEPDPNQLSLFVVE